MTWYNDPEPAGSPQPFASQLTGISTNQVATIGSGDLPTSLSNGSTKTVHWVVAGLGALMAMVTVGAGASLLLSKSSEELSMSDCAKKCATK